MPFPVDQPTPDVSLQLKDEEDEEGEDLLYLCGTNWVWGGSGRLGWGGKWEVGMGGGKWEVGMGGGSGRLGWGGKWEVGMGRKRITFLMCISRLSGNGSVGVANLDECLDSRGDFAPRGRLSCIRVRCLFKTWFVRWQ